MARTIPFLSKRNNSLQVTIPKNLIEITNWKEKDNILPIIDSSARNKSQIILINQRLDKSWSLEHNPGLKAICTLDLNAQGFLEGLLNFPPETREKIIKIRKQQLGSEKIKNLVRTGNLPDELRVIGHESDGTPVLGLNLNITKKEQIDFYKKRNEQLLKEIAENKQKIKELEK
jgi:hypothetical protein